MSAFTPEVRERLQRGLDMGWATGSVAVAVAAALSHIDALEARVAQEFNIASGYHAKWQAAEARVAAMQTIVDMACSVEEETAVLRAPDEPTDDDVYEIQGDYWEALMLAVDEYRGKAVQP